MRLPAFLRKAPLSTRRHAADRLGRRGGLRRLFAERLEDRKLLASISDIPNQTIVEDGSTSAINFTIEDVISPITPSDMLVVTAATSNATIVPVSNIVLGGSGTQRTVTVTPVPNLTGEVVVTLTVTDGGGQAVAPTIRTASDTFTLTISPDATNDAPVVAPIVDRSTVESTASTPIAITIGDDTTAASSLTIAGVSSNVTLVPNANLVFGGSGTARTLTVTPSAGLSGTTTIDVIVTDAGGLSTTRSFVLSVAPRYGIPAEPIDDVLIDADGSITINFAIANGSWTPTVSRTNTTLFRSVGTSSTHDLRLQGSGVNRTLRIRPAPGLYGESFVTVLDGNPSGASSTTFRVTVRPRAVADNFLGVAGRTSTFDLLRNDTLPVPVGSASIVSFTQPTNGLLTAGSVPGTVRYTPNVGFDGTDQFSYTIAYGATTRTATAYVKVADRWVIDPVHVDIGVDYENGAWFNETISDMAFGNPNAGGSSNPTFLDWDETIFFVSPVASVTLAESLSSTSFSFLGVAPGGSLWVLPQSQKAGLVWPGINTEAVSTGTFAAYSPVGDPRATTNAEWLRFEMAGFRIPAGAHFSLYQSGITPTVFWDSIDGANTSEPSLTHGANVSDTFWITTQTHAHANWTFSQPGRYEIDVRVKGMINGPGGLEEIVGPTNTLYFDVQSLQSASLKETPPSAVNDVVTVNEDSGATVVDVLGNDRSSPDKLERLTVTAVSGASNGTVTIAGDGQSVSYTPSSNFFGSDSFTYTITDEHGGTATAKVDVGVNPANDVVGVEVQTGQTQRSFVRNVDLIFSSGEGLASLLEAGRIQLTKMDLDGNNPIPLAGTVFVASVNGDKLRLDFGSQGIGGNRNTNAGDGYYRIGVDIDGDGTADSFHHFYRLLGDVNGDRQVNAMDRSLVMAASGSANPERDVNGDGIVNSVDLTLVSRAANRKLKDGLWVDD